MYKKINKKKQKKDADVKRKSIAQIYNYNIASA